MAKTTERRSTLSLTPVEKGAGQVSDRAHAQLRKAILHGEIPVGTILAEAELAEELRISRTPVREALRMLLQEELVEVGPRRQLVVPGMSPERRREVFLIREALEALSVTTATQAMSLDRIDELRLLTMRQRRAANADDAETFMDLDEQFHLELAEGAGLPMLVRFIGQMRAFTRLLGVEALRRPGRMAKVVEEHEAIVDAIEARDEPAAREAMSSHLHATERLAPDGEAG